MIYKKSKFFQLVAKDTTIDKWTIHSSKDAAVYALPLFEDTIGIYESFFVILLNNNNGIKGHAKISQGGVSATVVDPILIAKYAIDALAKGVVLVHNHPSASNKPSQEDRKLTEQIKQGLNLFCIKVLDHIILTNTSDYYSFADNGAL